MNETDDASDDSDQTNPSIVLPEAELGDDEVESIDVPTSASHPPPVPSLTSRPPPPPSGAPSRPSSPVARFSTDRSPPVSSAPSRPPVRRSSAAPRARPSAPPPPGFSIPRAPARPSTIRPPAIGSSRPSSPPRARDGSVDQQLAQLWELIGRQRLQVDELRSGLRNKEAHVEDLTAKVREDKARIHALSEKLAEPVDSAAVERRLDELEQRLRALSPEDQAAHESPDGNQLARIEDRLAHLEEGSEASRIRMRLERVGHRLEALEGRIVAAEEAQQSIREELRRYDALTPRIERLESLFAELVEEMREQREDVDLDGIRARLDDMEALVLKTGTEEEVLKKSLLEQQRELVKLRDSIAPASAASAPAGDAEDLTRIKGIGPKYARLLQETGVATIAAMAAMSEDEVKRVALQLGLKEKKVAGWVKNASLVASD